MLFNFKFNPLSLAVSLTLKVPILSSLLSYFTFLLFSPSLALLSPLVFFYSL